MRSSPALFTRTSSGPLASTRSISPAKRFAVGEIRGVTPTTDLLGNTVERGSVSPDERHLRAGGRETAGQLATNTATTPVTRTRLFLISLVA
jgi:hypothetical protein